MPRSNDLDLQALGSGHRQRLGGRAGLAREIQAGPVALEPRHLPQAHAVELKRTAGHRYAVIERQPLDGACLRGQRRGEGEQHGCEEQVHVPA
jgi:hypothetical protein